MISKAFEVCPSLFLIKLLFFMSSQIRDQKNILIPCITFQGERGKYMTKESLKSNKDRFTFICILTFETQKKKILFDNSTRTRTSNFISRAFLWWSTYHIVIFSPCPVFFMPIILILLYCSEWMWARCAQGTLAQQPRDRKATCCHGQCAQHNGQAGGGQQPLLPATKQPRFWEQTQGWGCHFWRAGVTLKCSLALTRSEARSDFFCC